MKFFNFQIFENFEKSKNFQFFFEKSNENSYGFPFDFMRKIKQFKTFFKLKIGIANFEKLHLRAPMDFGNVLGDF